MSEVASMIAIKRSDLFSLLFRNYDETQPQLFIEEDEAIYKQVFLIKA